MKEWIVCTTAHETYAFDTEFEAVSFASNCPGAFHVYQRSVAGVLQESRCEDKGLVVYIVCRSWCEGYEDHGWDILGTFAEYTSAEKYMKGLVEVRREDPDDWWIDELPVVEG